MQEPSNDQRRVLETLTKTSHFTKRTVPVNLEQNGPMTENAPPNANSASNDASRGMPYYERLRRDLRESLNKKRLIDNNLVRTSLDLSQATRLP